MTPALAEAPALETGYHELAIADIVESKSNPRRRFDDESLKELSASILQVGILEPLIVRNTGDGYELVAGARRLRAARAAGLTRVPAIVHDWTDTQALEAQLVENMQRADVHPLEEADGFKRLLTIGAYTPVSLAAKIGRSVRFVVNRLKLHMLTEKTRAAFDEGRITVSHAERLATLTPAQQQQALTDGCFSHVFEYESGKSVPVAAPVHDLVAWINEHVRLDLAHPDVQEEFPELVAEVTKAKAAGATVLMLSESYRQPEKPKPGDPLLHSLWQEVKATDKRAQLGVIVEGRRRGKTLHVAMIEPYKAPRAASPKQTEAQKEESKKFREKEAKRRAEEEAKQERESTVLKRAVEQLVKLPPELTDAGPLRVVAEALVGGDSFDPDVLDHAAKTLGVSKDVFSYHGEKVRAKLPGSKLFGLIAVLAVGAVTYDGERRAEAFKVFGVGLKAIDTAVAKELAEKSAAAPVKAKKATAKKGGKK